MAGFVGRVEPVLDACWAGAGGMCRGWPVLDACWTVLDCVGLVLDWCWTGVGGMCLVQIGLDLS